MLYIIGLKFKYKLTLKMITIKTINTIKNEYDPKYVDNIVNFYFGKYKFPVTKNTILNSAIVCLAYHEEKIVGSIRAISDLSRHAMIVDLIVDEKHRKKGTGASLLKSITCELCKYNVKNICITTEPGISWLVNFYEKNGFSILVESTLMEFKQ